MVAILDNVAKVKACALMLDIDNELVVRLFEHFLNSVRYDMIYVVFAAVTI